LILVVAAQRTTTGSHLARFSTLAEGAQDQRVFVTVRRQRTDCRLLMLFFLYIGIPFYVVAAPVFLAIRSASAAAVDAFVVVPEPCCDDVATEDIGPFEPSSVFLSSVKIEAVIRFEISAWIRRT